MKIEETIEAFVAYISTERRLAARTVTIYTEALRRFSTLLDEIGVERVEDVGAKEVRMWQMRVMDAGWAPATVKQALAALSSWFRFMRRQGWITTDVMAKIVPPKNPQHLPVFFREQEVEKIYSQREEMFSDDFVGVRDQLILRVFYETGMRRSELCGLKDNSFDLSMMQVKVLGKRNKERFIPIENDLAHNISAYLALKSKIEGCSEAFFVSEKGDPLTHAQVYSLVKKYMSKLSNADKISPHVFRHSFATHLLNEGADLEAIRQLMGHANVGVTEIYTHVSKEHMKEQYRNAHPRANKKKD